jgi:hypothetical protein
MLISCHVVHQLMLSITVTCFSMLTAIHKKRPGKLSKGIILLLDDARPHMANMTALNWEILNHSPYSPDLAPGD